MARSTAGGCNGKCHYPPLWIATRVAGSGRGNYRGRTLFSDAPAGWEPMFEIRCEESLLAEARHGNSTRNEPNDREAAEAVSPPGAIGERAKAVIRCRLCRETIVLETNFRPTAASCPHCGLKFVFDPQQEPLPVRGLRLRYSAVREAQQSPRNGAARAA